MGRIALPPSDIGKFRTTGAPAGGGPRLCRVCEKRPTYITAANNMYVGQSFPELNCLADVEQMCVARARPIVRVYSVRSGEKAYVGHVVNLEQKVATWYENLPPRPKNLPVLFISRPAMEEWGKNRGCKPGPSCFRVRPTYGIAHRVHGRETAVRCRP